MLSTEAGRTTAGARCVQMLHQRQPPGRSARTISRGPDMATRGRATIASRRQEPPSLLLPGRAVSAISLYLFTARPGNDNGPTRNEHYGNELPYKFIRCLRPVYTWGAAQRRRLSSLCGCLCLMPLFAASRVMLLLRLRCRSWAVINTVESSCRRGPTVAAASGRRAHVAPSSSRFFCPRAPAVICATSVIIRARTYYREGSTLKLTAQPPNALYGHHEQQR